MSAVEAADGSNREREALLGLFTSLLRPLMPIALERGISARDVSDAVRRAYVQVLESRLSEQDRKLSDARLALFAGLTRTEVKRFRDLRGEADQVSKVDDDKSSALFVQVARLLSVWHTHPKFSGAYGLALDLDLQRSPGSSRRSFAELVETVCPGVDQEAILDQLLATDSVEVVDQATIRCQSRVAVFGKKADEAVGRINRAAKCLEAAARSFAYSLQQADIANGYFERMVVSDHSLSLKSRDEFALVAQVRGDAYVAELDTWLSKNTQPDVSPNGKRYGVGVYFFEEAQSEQQPESDASSGADLASSRIAEAYKPVDEIDVLAPLSSFKLEIENPGDK